MRSGEEDWPAREGQLGVAHEQGCHQREDHRARYPRALARGREIEHLRSEEQHRDKPVEPPAVRVGRSRRGHQHDDGGAHQQRARQAVQAKRGESRHGGQAQDGWRQRQQVAAHELAQTAG
jgi:hypothetical protein